jgi:O-antigen/teichoic acid export membrane protein
VLAAAEIVGKVSTFALVLVAARRLPTSTFGVYALCISVALLLSAIPAWGFDQQLVQRGSVSPERLSALVGQAATLRFSLVMITFGGAAAVVALTGALPVELFLPILAATLLDTMTDVGRGAAAVRRDQSWVARALALQRITTATVAIAVLFLAPASARTTGLGLAYLVGSVLGLSIVAVGMHRREVPLRLLRNDWEDVGTTVRRSSQVGIENVFGMLLFRSDTPLLAVLAGSVAVAEYAVSYRLIESTLFLSWTLVYATFPVVAALRSDPAGARAKVDRALAVGSFLFCAFAAVAIAGAGTLTGLFGAQYRAESAPVLVALALAPLGFFLLQLFTTALISHERYVDSMVITGVALLANVGANLVLIPRFGALGAGITTTASYVGAGVVAHARARATGSAAPPPTAVLAFVLPALAASVSCRLVLGDGATSLIVAGLLFAAAVAGLGALGVGGPRLVLELGRGLLRRLTRRRVLL